jgi:heme-degrading monooxygenase HmoA
MVRWASVEAHMDFRNSDLFKEWQVLTHPFYSTKPTVTHFHEPIGT